MILKYDEEENTTDIKIDGNTIGTIDGPLLTRNGSPHPQSDNIEEFFGLISETDPDVYRRCLFDVAIGDVEQS